MGAVSRLHMAGGLPNGALKGRGTAQNPANRFDREHVEPFDDGWSSEEPQARPQTSLMRDATRNIIARNDSPDLGFDRSINPYRGCEHGCIYCFARPTHAYLGLSPGLDFETKIVFKPEAARLLEAELSKPRYQPAVLALGTNTDPYQPVERTLGLTRGILEVLERFNHPVSIVTKSAGVLRDIELLARMAAKNLARVHLSITTLDPALARAMEPRAAAPARRLATITRARECRNPHRGDGRANDPRRERCRAGKHSRSRIRGGGHGRPYAIAAPAPRTRPLIHGLAAHPSARPRQPCAEPDPPEPRRPAERSGLRLTLHRHRPARRPAATALCTRRAAAPAGRPAAETRCHAIPRAKGGA